LIKRNSKEIWWEVFLISWSTSKINKLLNKLSQILLRTIWTDMGLLIAVCENTARPRRGDWKNHMVVFPLVTVQQDSGFNWKASNRLIVQPVLLYHNGYDERGRVFVL
jgi:hypothetical protein